MQRRADPALSQILAAKIVPLRVLSSLLTLTIDASSSSSFVGTSLLLSGPEGIIFTQPLQEPSWQTSQLGSSACGGLGRWPA